MRILTLLLLATVLVSGCQRPPSTVHLSGQFEEFESGQSVYLYRSADRLNYREWLTALDTAELNDLGQFQFTVSPEQGDLYQVAGDNGFPLFNDIYLAPGDSLDVHVPVRSDTTQVSYTGSGARIYGIYDALDSLWQNDESFQKNYFDIAQMDIDSAWEFIDDRFGKRIGLVDAHFAGHPEWDVMADVVRNNTYYRNARDYYDYLYYHNYYSKDTFLYFIPESGYYSFLDTALLTEPPDYYSFEYMHFLSGYLRDCFNRDFAELEDSMRYADRFNLMLKTAGTHLSGEALDRAYLSIADEFGFFMERDDFFERMDSMDAYFAENYHSLPNYKKFQFVTTKFEKLRPGSPAPDMALPNVNGDTVRLSDHLGKVLYLDFWGTWCFPCLQELPHSLELQEAYAGKPVEFIYVGLQSGDDQIQTWKDFILGEMSLSYAPFLEQMTYPGLHLLADGQFGNPALKPFMLRAAPTYVLIGTDGRLISANAPRPSSDKIKELLDEALLNI